MLILGSSQDNSMEDILLNLAKEAARKSSRAMLEIYRSDDFGVDTKDDATPVTKADLESESVIRQVLSKSEIGIMSEESSNEKPIPKEGRLWVVDPLDGTSDFIKKTDDFSAMIGLVESGEPIIGVVCAPAKNRLYFAVKGEGAFVEGIDGADARKISVSEIGDLISARPVFSRFHLGEKEQELLRDIGIKEYNKMGSSGLKICSIAEGTSAFYLTFTKRMNLWDVCAADVILKEAGGRISDIRGRALSYNGSEINLENGVLATNGFLHEALITKINS